MIITVQQASQMPPAQKSKLAQQINAVLAKDKRNFDALMSAAAIYYAATRIGEAIGYLEQAAALRKNDPGIRQWLAVACAEIRDFRKAKIHSRKLIELDPRKGENWEVRARVLDGAGDPAGALAAFEKQKSIMGETAELVFQMGNCHFYMGDHATAEAHYRRTLELEPTHALALYGLSTIHRFSEDEVGDYITAIEAAVPANKDMPDYNISALYYGAGKAMDDVKRHDDAFSWYKKANDVRKPEEPPVLSRQFDNNRAAFTRSYMSERAGWGDRQSQPVFVLGMPRSGTTLVESLIAAHPKMAAGGELPTLPDIARQIGSMQAPVEEFIAVSKKLTQADVKDMARTYLSGARAICGTDGRFTDKMPHNFMNIGLALLLFPEAKIIHCRRDPVDTCVSIYTNGMTPAHNHYKSELTTLGTYYNLYLDLMATWHDVFPGRILDVFYEDVTINTELNARRMIDFCGLRWDDRVLERENSQSAVRTLSAWQVRQPIYTSADGKWRRYEKHLAPLLEALGDCVNSYREALAGLSPDGEKAEAVK